MKSLGLDAFHFRILTVVRLYFSNVLGRFFRSKIVSLLGFCRENQSGHAVAFQSGPNAKTTARSEMLLSQSDCFILTDKK
jgi:hypothetical protein